MAEVIPKWLQRIWNEWNIRGVVLTSLCLQILLIFLAPLRKRIKSSQKQPSVRRAIIWIAYLLADWVAVFAIGLISNSEENKSSCDEQVSIDPALLAFWAPFLLLHLGGPDSITAFSVEDNELWLRHMFGFIVEFIMTAYVFVLAIPYDLWLPTLLVFLVGTIKYVERTVALHHACSEYFKDSLVRVPHVGGGSRGGAQLKEEEEEEEEFEKMVKLVRVEPEEEVIDMEEREMAHAREEKYIDKDDTRNEIEIIRDGYSLYRRFRGLIVDQMVVLDSRKWTREFFFLLKPRDGFRLMEVELNFVYDTLFTKRDIMNYSSFWYIFFRLTGSYCFILHSICTALIAVALLLFRFQHHKAVINNRPFDIAVTYCLLIGAIILDLVAHITFLFSDWTIKSSPRDQLPTNKYRRIQKCRRFSIFGAERWSKSISKLNMISYSFNAWSSTSLPYHSRQMKKIFKSRPNVLPVDEKLEMFIFNEIKEMAKEAEDPTTAKEMHSSRGERALHRYRDIDSIAASVGKNIEYDISLLIWHIATDLLYTTTTDREEEEEEGHRRFCKILSEYMLYLHVMEPSLMSVVAGSFKFRYKESCIDGVKVVLQRQQKHGTSLKNHTQVCQKLMSQDLKPVPVDSYGKNSILFDGCKLAKELMDRHNPSEMWEMMSKVWVEMLCYGASHCSGTMHAQQLSKGGEFITFVWILMAHFGLGDHFG